MTALASGNPGCGSKIGGGSTKTPLQPEKARVSASPSSISAIATSQPRSDQDLPRSALRTTARTGWPALSKVRATPPPTLPVIPVMAYMTNMPQLEWNGTNGRKGGLLSKATWWHIIHDIKSLIHHGPERTTSLQCRRAGGGRRSGQLRQGCRSPRPDALGSQSRGRAPRRAHRRAAAGPNHALLEPHGRRSAPLHQHQPVGARNRRCRDGGGRFIRLRAGPFARQHGRVYFPPVALSPYPPVPGSLPG